MVFNAVNNRKVLREYVRVVLEEDDGGGAYGGFDFAGAIGPYGVSFGSSKDLYNVFVKPFVDVVDTTVGKTKEISVRAQTLLRVAIESAISTIIPILSGDYNKIFEREHAALQKLKSQYQEVYDATWTSFKDLDVAILSFMYDPTAMITAKFIQEAPVQTVNVLNVLSGGKLDNFLNKVKETFKLDGKTVKPLSRTSKDFGAEPSGGGWDTGMGIGDMGLESVIREDDNGDKKKDDRKSKLVAVLTQKGVKNAIKANPDVQHMQKASQELVKKTLGEIIARAKNVSSAQSVAALQEKIGKKFKGIENLSNVPQEQRQATEKMLLKNVKDSTLLMYIKGLEQQVEKALNVGVPKNHPFINAYNEAISQIKTLQ